MAIIPTANGIDTIQEDDEDGGEGERGTIGEGMTGTEGAGATVST